MKGYSSSQISAADSSILTTITRKLAPLTGTILVVLAFIIHGRYVTDHLSRHRISRSLHRRTPFSLTSSELTSSSFALPYDPQHDDPNHYIPPPLFIYRRTKKSGSSSMLAVLLPQMTAMGYTPLYFIKGEMEMAVYNEFVRESPRHLFIAEHNRITRAHHPLGLAVIADTVRDGYEQITSFCRYVRKIKTCTAEMVECLKSEEALSQMKYRWGGRDSEDNETYIDLPLSAKYSALSTSVLRTVFPNITININTNYNRKFSTCPERSILRIVYDEYYQELEKQIEKLKKRMLIITGYPFKVDKFYNGTITIDEMMDAAELLEREKYPDMGKMQKKLKGKSKYSDVHLELRSSTKHWYLNEDGKLDLKSRNSLSPTTTNDSSSE